MRKVGRAALSVQLPIWRPVSSPAGERSVQGLPWVMALDVTPHR